MKIRIKRLAITLLVYAVVFIAVVSIMARITPKVSSGFLAIIIIVCVFGVPGVAAFLVLNLCEKRKNATTSKEKELSVKQTPPSAEEKPKPTRFAARLFPKPAEEKLPDKNHDSQFIRLRQYREKLQAYSETLKNRNEELDKRKEELDKKEKLLKRYERVLKNEEDRILSTAKAIKTEEQMARYEQQLHLLERRVFDWVRLREKDESTAFEELRNKVEVFVRAQDALPEEMTGLEFEQYFAGILVKNGYTNVEVTKKTGDFGADVIATLGGVKYAFQCKYYTAPVGFEAVYQIHAAKTMYGAHVAVVATNSVFTKPAQIAAEELKVLLWDGGMLSRLAAEKS